MQQVMLDDKIYREAKRRAEATGFGSVDEFIADLLQHDFAAQAEDFDARFTPDVNAYLDRIAAQMDRGESLNVAEVERHLDEVRSAWRKDRAS